MIATHCHSRSASRPWLPYRCSVRYSFSSMEVRVERPQISSPLRSPLMPQAILCTLHCTILGELTRAVFGRRFAPKGGKCHGHGPYEETADSGDDQSTRPRAPDPPTRARTLRGTRQGGRPRTGRLAQGRRGDPREENSNRSRLIHRSSRRLRMPRSTNRGFGIPPSRPRILGPGADLREVLPS